MRQGEIKMKTHATSTALALGLTAALAVPAFAGSYDPAPEPSPVAPALPAVPVTGDWGGFYAGAQLGYADIDADEGEDGDDGLYGVHAGYRWDFGQTVAGVEVDYDRADIDIGDEDLDYIARIKGQYGWDFGKTLAYGTAGYAYSDTSLGDENGWTAGLGVAYQVTQAWTLGGEVLYQEFDEFGDSDIGAEATTATIRASYRF